MNKKTFQSNKGITLIELLAVLAILSVLSITIYSVLLSGIRSYDKVLDKNDLRDEGNYIMSYLNNEFYKLKTSEISEKKLPESGTNDFYLVKSNGTKIGIIHSKIIINNNSIAPTNENIVLTSDSKIVEISPDLFEITLVLKHKNSNEQLNLSSTLSVVNDIREN